MFLELSPGVFYFKMRRTWLITCVSAHTLSFEPFHTVLIDYIFYSFYEINP